MLAVLRQEWKGRRFTILIVSGIMLAVNAAAFISQLVSYADGSVYPGLMSIIWTSIAGVVTFFIATFYVLFAGAGNIGRVLFTDSSYLLLSLPRRGFSVLGGKICIGTAEFLIYAVQAGLYASVHMTAFMTVGAPAGAGNPGDFLQVIGLLYRTVFVSNLHAVLFVLVDMLLFFVAASILISSAAIFIRSFIKSKRFSTVLTVAALFLMIQIPVWLAETLYRHGISPVSRFGIRLYMPAFEDFAQWSAGVMQFNLYWVPLVTGIVFSVLYFAGASLLFEKKVEV